jgi:DNA-binding transcriptional regulator YbjK
MATVKGEQRRAALVEVARDILVAEGIDGLNHRAVAARAGVAVGLATYYFPTSDDLRLAAVDTLAAADLARMEAVVAGVRRRRRTAASTARLVVGLLVPGERDELVSWYERYVRGGRSPLLAGAARRVNAAARRHVETLLERCGHPDAPAGVTLAVVDGAVVGTLAEGATHRARLAATEALTAVLESFRSH